MAIVDVDGGNHLPADSQPKSVVLVWGLALTGRSICVHQMNRVNSCNDFGHIDQHQNVSVCISIIIRPDRSTTYVDAAYCYRPSSVVCRTVCRSVTVVSPAKTAEQIQFGFRTQVGPTIQIYQTYHGKRQFREGKRRPIVKYRDTAVSCTAVPIRCRLVCVLGWKFVKYLHHILNMKLFWRYAVEVVIWIYI